MQQRAAAVAIEGEMQRGMQREGCRESKDFCVLALFCLLGSPRYIGELLLQHHYLYDARV
jgi:hypothetical protein